MKKNLHYLCAPSGLFAIFATSDNIEAMSYTITDHQGSLAAYSSSGTWTRLSYDAWGRRRNAADGSYDNLPAQATDRGYTGHEHLDEFGLINMNGRLYDPMLGRMLSPDIVVQQTDYTQSYNRYSYCFNNPLRFTDPTGWVVEIPPQYLEMFNIVGLYNNNNEAFRDLLVEKGIEPSSVRYNTEETEGVLKTTASWMIGKDSYEMVRYENLTLPRGKQKCKMSCAAYCFAGQEMSRYGGNSELTEEYWMCLAPDSHTKGISVRNASEEYKQTSNLFSEYSEEDYYDSEGRPLSMKRDFLYRRTYDEFSENLGVMLIFDTPIGNHAVNVTSAAKLSINGRTSDKNHSVWYWDSSMVEGGIKHLNSDKLNDLIGRFTFYPNR